MRRILVVLVILAVGIGGLAALWIFRGREISSLIDRYWPMETQSTPIQSIAYERSRTGDTLICDGVSFSLNDVTPGLPECWLNQGQPTCLGRAAVKFFRSARLNPHPRILLSVSLLHRLRPIMPSSPRVIAFSSGPHRSIST